MKRNYSRKAKALVLFTAVAFLFANGATANAASKSITCYKGTTVKKVTAANPKCPTDTQQLSQKLHLQHQQLVEQLPFPETTRATSTSFGEIPTYKLLQQQLRELEMS